MVSVNEHTHTPITQVVEPKPYPGLRVSPESGCVPVGGTTPISLHLHPTAVDTFDSELAVKVREGRTLRLKLAGVVEKPIVGIDRVSISASVFSLPTCVLFLPSFLPLLPVSFSYTHTHTHAHTHTRMHTHTHACTHTHARLYTSTHTHTYTHSRTCTAHMHTHMHAHTHTHTHTHAHAHTHTPSPSSLASISTFP